MPVPRHSVALPSVQLADTASALFGMAGVRVTEVEREAAGGTVWAVADVVPECPGCGTVAEHVHEYVTTRPRDVRHGAGEADVCLVKRRWAGENEECPRSAARCRRPR